MKSKVVIGFLGTRLDDGDSPERWSRWRPSVALFAHEGFKPDRLELLTTHTGHVDLAQRIGQDIAEISPHAAVVPHLLDVKDPWNFQEVYAALHAFASSYTFREDCEYFVHLTTGTHVAQICLFLLAESKYFPARLVETFNHGAAVEDRWKGTLEVIDLNLAAYDLIAKRFEKEKITSQGLLKGGIATRNERFNALMQRIEKVALKSTAPILLSGPTGAGKSQLAKRIYELRQRRHQVEGTLVEVNCATLRGDNAMSALFGHKKGAFTGALADRAGLLKSADKGALFLDEIGELGLEEQAMLLRALEDKTFTPMGADKEVSSDFQLIAGTNRDLQQACAKGLFREDLLARINLWHFELPGLRARVEDIEPNLEYETQRASQLLGKNITWSLEAKNLFLKYAYSAPWSGNFREFAATILRMATLCDGARITLEDVELELSDKKSVAQAPLVEFPLCAKALSSEQYVASDRFDLAGLEVVLKAVMASKSAAQAGRELFAASRLSKASVNDTDRIRKLLSGWGLDYATVKESLAN